MYNNTTLDPTKIYGMGHGLAQVIDLAPTRENAKLAEAQAERKAREQEHLDQMRQAKLEGQLAKIHNGIRDADREAVANKVKDYQALVYDNIEGYRKGDIKSVMALDEGLRNLNSTIDSSNDLAKKEALIDNQIEKNGGMGNHWNADLWEQSKKTAYADKGNFGDYYGNIPLAKLDYQKDYRENVLPMVRGKGTTTTVPITNAYGQIVNTITTDIGGDDVKAIHTARVSDPRIHLQLQKELADNPALKEQFTDKNGNIDYVGLYNTHITPEMATQRINIKAPVSPSQSGGPSYTQEVPITVTGTKSAPRYSFQLAPDGKSVNTPIGGKNYDVTDIQGGYLDENGVPHGIAIVAKANDHNLLQEAKLQKAVAAYPKKLEDLAKWQIENLSRADAGKDEKGKPLEGTTVAQQREYITKTYKAKKDELLKQAPTQKDFPLETEKVPISGDDLLLSNKGINFMEVLKGNTPKGVRKIDQTTENKPASKSKKYKGVDPKTGDPIFE